MAEEQRHARAKMNDLAAGGKSSIELAARAFFGLLLAVIAVAALAAGTLYFAAFIAIGSAYAAREWHRMIEPVHFGLESILTGMAVCGAISAGVLLRAPLLPWGLIVAGSVANVVLGQMRKGHPFWQGLGALYIGVPALSLVAIRDATAGGPWIVFGLFIVIWAADTGALLAGKTIGGPKFVPALSPNKTWSGFFGGLLLAALAEAIYVNAIGGNTKLAALYGLCLALVACAGDLFESWVKRVFNRKNSGSLIPGHGGVLDRIDSTLFVAPIGALLVFAANVDVLFGAHP